jgi:hypothetical protein
MFVDGARATHAVTNQTGDYRRLLRDGSGMQFAGVMNKDFYQNVARMAGMDIQRDAARWDPIARMIANASGHDPFNYPQFSIASAPNTAAASRCNPRQITIFPGAGSLARAR